MEPNPYSLRNIERERLNRPGSYFLAAVILGTVFYGLLVLYIAELHFLKHVLRLI
jgi:hypothetical protein